MAEDNVFDEVNKGKYDKKYERDYIPESAIRKFEKQGQREREAIRKTATKVKEYSKFAKDKSIERVKRIAERVAAGTKPGHIARGLRQTQNTSLGYPRNYDQSVNLTTNDSPPPKTPKPYHIEMKEHRDNGFRPHIPKSLVKEPDIEGYQRNLLLQPSRNIWEEPRKSNVWDETFGRIKNRKSIFESKR